MLLSRLAVAAMGLTVILAAADAFWTKPVTQWTDKEVQTMLTDSPWADRMEVETGERGNVGNADDSKGPMQGNLTAPVVVMWQSALPVKLALYGRSDNPQAKALVERQEANPVLRLTGLPGQFRANAQDVAKLTGDTVIKIKGKPDVHPAGIELSNAPAPGRGAPKQEAPQQEEAPAAAPAGRGGRGAGAVSLPPAGFGGGRGRGGAPFDIYMVFPKDFVVEADKEFEFQTKVGKMQIRKKFKLKDMMYNGKLEM